jgi:hypothetical protein
MVKVGDLEESRKDSVPYMLKYRMPYGVKMCRKFHLKSGGTIREKMRIFSERKRVLTTVIHSSNRDFYKILGHYLIKVTKMMKAVLRD